MEYVIPWWAAIVGLLVAIFAILKNLNPTYALFLGAIVGCVAGGASLSDTLTTLISGTNGVMGTALRVLAAGMLAGVMMGSGAAESIANAIVKKLGRQRAILSLALSTLVLTAVGVFIPIAVMIVAPIGLAVCKETGHSKLSLLIALSGGGKAGNVISPNPNTIAAASGYGVTLSEVMLGGVIPAIVGLVVAVLLANVTKDKGEKITDSDIEQSEQEEMIPLSKALITPVLAIVLLLISPLGRLLKIDALANLELDALFVLPLASVIGTIAMGQGSKLLSYANDGLNRVKDTVLILIGAGGIAGLIGASDLSTQLINVISKTGISAELLAPISGVIMSLAVGSTSTAVILATNSFSDVILQTGVNPVSAAVMTHTGATALDHVPQGNYFHVTAEAVKMDIKDRMKVIPYEFLVGLSMTLVSMLMNLFM